MKLNINLRIFIKTACTLFSNVWGKIIIGKCNRCKCKVVKHLFIYSTVHTFHNFLHNIKWSTNVQMLHDLIKSVCSLFLWELQVTVLKPSRDFSKTNNIWKVSFHCYRPNIFSRFHVFSKFHCSLVLRPIIHATGIFFRIPNWSNCRSQFWSINMTLVKLSYF